MDRFKTLIILALVCWMGLLGYTSIVSISGGGTGASTAASARTNLDVQQADTELSALAGLTSAADKVPYFTGSGTCSTMTVTSAARGLLDDTTTGAMLTTLGAAPGPVSSASAPTVNDDSGDGYAVGQVWINTTTKIPYILSDATVGAAVWRAVLGQQRLRMYIASGVVYSVVEGYSSGSWLTLKGPVTVSQTVGTAALGTSASGTGISMPAGYATAADQPTEGDYWLQSLDGSGSFGVTWTPASDSSVRWEITASQPAVNYEQVHGYVGNPDFATGPGVRVHIGRHGGASTTGAANNNGATTTGTNCVAGGPAEAMLGWTDGTAGWATAACRQTTTFAIPSLTAPTQALTTMAMAIIALRPATGGATATVTGVELTVYPQAGELSW